MCFHLYFLITSHAVPKCQTVNYTPHQLAMLAGVNKRPQYGLERSTLKSRLGSVVDLQEGEEIEYIRKGITRDVKKLLENNIHKLRNHFNNCDKHQTGDSSITAPSHRLPVVFVPAATRRPPNYLLTAYGRLRFPKSIQGWPRPDRLPHRGRASPLPSYLSGCLPARLLRGGALSIMTRCCL